MQGERVGGDGDHASVTSNMALVSHSHSTYAIPGHSHLPSTVGAVTVGLI